MIKVNVNRLELVEGWVEDNPTVRGSFDFPIHAGIGSTSSSLIYFEVAPGNRIPRHTHTCEEVLLIEGGKGEGEVGDEQGPLETGDLVVIPAHAPHLVRNTGKEKLKVVGFFPSSTVITTLEDQILPFETQVLVVPDPEYALKNQ